MKLQNKSVDFTTYPYTFFSKIWWYQTSASLHVKEAGNPQSRKSHCHVLFLVHCYCFGRLCYREKTAQWCTDAFSYSIDKAVTTAGFNSGVQFCEVFRGQRWKLAIRVLLFCWHPLIIVLRFTKILFEVWLLLIFGLEAKKTSILVDLINPLFALLSHNSKCQGRQTHT